MDNLWMGVKNSRYFTESEKRTVYALAAIYNYRGPINESVLAKMREGLAELAKKDGATVDEKALDKLLDLMKSSSKFSAYLGDMLGKSWDKILAYYKTSLDKPKAEIINLINTGVYDFPRGTMDREMDDMRKLTAFWLRDLRKVLIDDIKIKYSKCLVAESMENSADIVLTFQSFNPGRLNESGQWSFLDRSASAVSETEPFKTLKQVSGLNRTFNNATVNKFAELSRNIGGPDCGKFTSLGTLADKLCDIRGESPSADQLVKADPMLRFLPDYRSMIESFEMMAVVATVLEVATELKK